MKKLACILTLALAFVVQPAFAQAKKKPGDAAAPAEAAPAAQPAAEAKAPGKPAKPFPFSTTVDELDVAGKSFIHNNQDGKKVKFILGATAEVKQGEAAAKFEDIKVGDTVSGLRMKKNEDGTEYEIVKITKFGAKPAAKDDGEKKKKKDK